MLEKEKNKEEQNEYAENVKGQIVFILDAESGKKGYFCIGCKNEMQAVKSKIKGRKSYFRHDATDVKKQERECTFSNQNYRHRQAMSILNRIRRIKVPPLYKLPPKNSNGKAIKIKDSEFIEAKYTKSELTFYETDSGEVKFGKNPEIENRNLLIRPDVTFFNAQNKPILLIEIVVTHKIDDEKLAKIKRLGIDTVQITIPKDSLENIEKSFSEGKRIKWIHNNEQERTKYIYTSNEHSEGVPQIDEFQKRIFSESYGCRKFQINQLIRTIKRCLESQHYRGIEQGFRREIQRVERNTDESEQRLEDYRNGIRERVNKRFKPRRDAIEVERARLNSEEEEIKKLFQAEQRKLDTYFGENESEINERRKNLEERYLKRRGEIRAEQERVENAILEVQFFEHTERELIDKGKGIDRDIEITRGRIDREQEYRANLPDKFKQLESQELIRFKDEKRKIREEKEHLPEVFAEKERQLESEFEEIRRGRIKQVKTGNCNEPSEFSSRLKKILDTRGLFNDWDERQATFERYKTALEHFRKGTYKNWNDTK